MFKHLLKYFLAFVIAATSSGPVFAQPHTPGSVPYFLSEPFSIGGNFSGMGVQDTGEPWQVRLFDDVLSLKLEYPDLKCGGNPQLLRSTSEWVLFRERFSYGQQDCEDGGFVLIRDRRDRSVDYIWCGASGANATAVLLRSGLEDFSTEKLVELTREAFPETGKTDAYTHLCIAARKGKL